MTVGCKSAEGPLPPSPWVIRFIAGVRPGGRVLDVACGRGRHLRLALERGLSVTGIDRDLSGVGDLEGRPDASLVAADLEDGRPFPLAGQAFDGVIVTNYLWRPILPDIVGAVARDGILIYETFAAGNERYGKPGNPAFLLRPGELIGAVAPKLTPIAFETVKEGNPLRVLQRIAAVGPDHIWLNDPPAL
ncbi:MAG TPA: class I SAM-dependent methyltransferase [Hyphomicrobiaceae bacterium]|nr:class I SAM-dependent methyltransferase [Hyphomicrobiaceae bacterium]